MKIRHLYRWQSIDGTITYDFPLNAYEYESRQQFDAAFYNVAGADYALDAATFRPAPKQPGIEAVRFALVGSPDAIDAELDNLKSAIQLGALGKLWVIGALGERRWAYARASEMPAASIRTGFRRLQTVAIGFTRLSDWFGETPLTGSLVVNAGGATQFNIANTGNIPANRGVIRFRSNAAPGWAAGWQLLNVNNGYAVTCNRAATSADDELRLTIHSYAVEWSTNNGADYTPAYNDVVLGPKQAGLFRLEKGVNIVRFIAASGNTPNLTIEWTFEVPYA